MWRDVRCRHVVPSDERNNGRKECPECTNSAAVLRSEHGHKYDYSERRHKAEALHERCDDAANGKGEDECKDAHSYNGVTSYFFVFFFRYIWIDETFVNILGEECARA